MADEWGQVGINVVESLSACPFVLQSAEKVDHLTEDCVKMTCRSGTGTAFEVETFEQQITQGPSGAITGQSVGKIMNVEIAVFVSCLISSGYFQGVTCLNCSER